MAVSRHPGAAANGGAGPCGRMSIA
jgi:hypothetical protein